MFLERDDRLGPLQLPLQPTVLGFELFHARVNRPRLGSSPASAHVLQGALLALPTPVGEQGRVQPLATQQGAQLAGLLAGVGLREDAEPILRGKAPTLGLRRHFRIGIGRA